jgi:hypothetical protein
MLSTFLVSAASLAAGSFGAHPAVVAAKDTLGIGVLGTVRRFA